LVFDLHVETVLKLVLVALRLLLVENGDLLLDEQSLEIKLIILRLLALLGFRDCLVELVHCVLGFNRFSQADLARSQKQQAGFVARLGL
jgi:hypothetical protein